MLRYLSACATRIGSHMLRPPLLVSAITRKASKLFTYYCIGGGAITFGVFDKEIVAALHAAGAVAGLLWWWAEYRARAAWEKGRMEGVEATLAILRDASRATSGATEKGDAHG